jgi:phosphoglycolate phosphatase
VRGPRAVLFDLDGTRIDSRADLATAVNLVRAELSLPAFALAEVVARVGEGARNLVRRALPESIDGEAFEAAFASFGRHYRRVCLDETRPYPGIPELLARLAPVRPGPRRPLAVLTNKPEAVSRHILAGLGLAGFFREVVGGDTLPTRKPDPAGVVHLARLLAVPPAELLLVGDSAIDARTAAAAGCRFVFVEWGLASAAERDELRGEVRAGDAAGLEARILEA